MSTEDPDAPDPLALAAFFAVALFAAIGLPDDASIESEKEDAVADEVVEEISHDASAVSQLIDQSEEGNSEVIPSPPALPDNSQTEVHSVIEVAQLVSHSAEIVSHPIVQAEKSESSVTLIAPEPTIETQHGRRLSRMSIRTQYVTGYLRMDGWGGTGLDRRKIKLARLVCGGFIGGSSLYCTHL